jgi:hypothetical protein
VALSGPLRDSGAFAAGAGEPGLSGARDREIHGVLPASRGAARRREPRARSSPACTAHFPTALAAIVLLTAVCVPVARAEQPLPDTSDAATWTTDGPPAGFVTIGDTTYLGGSFSYVGPVTGSGFLMDPQTGEHAPAPQIAGAAHLTGPFDHQLRLVCADPSQIETTVAQLKNLGGVKDTQTRVVMRRLV